MHTHQTRLQNLLDLRYFSGTGDPAYDAGGNLLTIYDHKMGSPQTHSFSYDDLDRLTSASASGGTGGIYSESYTYNNDTGNLSAKGGVDYYYEDPSHVHAVTRLSNGNTYGYDANGNMTQRNIGGVSYTLEYDAENRLTTVKQGATTIAAFMYDGDGLRVKGTVNGVTTAYVGEILEWTGSTSSMVKYYYAGSNRVAMRVGSNNPKWLLSDHLGSQSVVASYNGLTKEGELRYKAWGEIRHTSGSTPTKRQYTGQVNEDLIKLYWIGSRWYDPELGRWIQPDSIVPEAAQGVQAWDRYAYVNNSPVKYIDPTGYMMDDGIGGSDGGCGLQRCKVNRISLTLYQDKPKQTYNFPDRPDYQSIGIYFGQFGSLLYLLFSQVEPTPTTEFLAPLVGSVFSGGFSLSIDKFGRIYFTPGISIGRTLVSYPIQGLPSVTYTLGYIEKGKFNGPDGNGTDVDIDNLLNGLGRSHGLCGPIFPCINRVYSLTSSANAWEWGFGTPQINLITLGFGLKP